MATPGETVLEFAAAWGRADLDAIMDAFADGAIYHNIPMDPLEGKDDIRAAIEGFMLMSPGGIGFEVHHQVTDGNIVMNERTDTFALESGDMALRVMGVFELNDDGKIAKWRDYFDMTPFTQG